MGSKSKDKCPYKNEAEGGLTDRRGGRDKTTEAKSGVTWPRTRELPEPPEAGRGESFFWKQPPTRTAVRRYTALMLRVLLLKS